MGEKANLPKPALIGILIAVIFIAAFFMFRSMAPPSGGQTYPDPPELVWLKQKSKEVGGDWSKFTPEEQARAEKLTNGRGAMSAGIYGGNSKNNAAR